MIYLGSEYLASDLISYYTFPGLHIITCYNENNTQCAELSTMYYGCYNSLFYGQIYQKNIG